VSPRNGESMSTDRLQDIWTLIEDDPRGITLADVQWLAWEVRRLRRALSEQTFRADTATEALERARRRQSLAIRIAADGLGFRSDGRVPP
jgi:hypothetical protein